MLGIDSDADFYALDCYTLAGDLEVDPARFRVDEKAVYTRRIRGEGNRVKNLSLQGCKDPVGFGYRPPGGVYRPPGNLTRNMKCPTLGLSWYRPYHCSRTTSSSEMSS